MVVEAVFDVIEVKKCDEYQQLAGRVLNDIKIFDEFIAFEDINIHNCSKRCDNSGQLTIADDSQCEGVKINKIWTYGHYFNELESGISAMVACNNTRLDLEDLVLFKKLNENEAMHHRYIYMVKTCGKFLIDATNEIVKMNIFENLDTVMNNDVSDDNLDIFIEEGWINEEIKEKCIELRNRYLDIKNNHLQLWNIQAVRTAKCWWEILDLADEIKSLQINLKKAGEP